MFLLLPFLLLAPGIGLTAILRKRLAEPLSLLEQALVTLAGGGLLTTWLSLILAEFGRFSLPTLSILVTALTLTFLYIARRSPQVDTPTRAQTSTFDYLAVGLIGIAFLLSIPANQYFIGGRDHGVYIHTGIHIAQHGSILFEDNVLHNLPNDLHEAVINPDIETWIPGFPGPWSEGQRLAGFTLRDAEAGIVAPHGFHFYPALIAIFAATGGPKLALYATLYAGLTALLAVYLVVRRSVGQRVGILLLFLLICNVAQQWYLSTPSAEILAMLAFWTGLWALLRTQANPHSLLLNMFAGFCFGAVHLAKLDMLLIPFALTAYWGFIWLRRSLTRAQITSIITYLLISTHAVLHGFFIATIYFLDHVVRSIFPDFLAEPLAAAADGLPYPNDILSNLIAQQGIVLLLIAAAALVSAILLRLLQPLLSNLLDRLIPFERWLRCVLIFLIGIWLTGQLAALMQPETSVINAFFLNRLYLTRIGLLAGMFGFIWLAIVVRTPAQTLLVWMLFANSAYLFVVGAQTAPDQFWSARRFVPVVFPALLLAGLWAVENGTAWLIKRLNLPNGLTWLPLAGLVLILLAGFAPHVQPQLGFTEFENVYPQLEAVSAELTSSDILLFEASGPAYLFGLPLWQTFGHTVFQIEQRNANDPRLDAAVQHWQDEGRNVYWLKIPELELPEWVRNSAEITTTHRIITSVMEQPRDRIPHTANIYDLTIQLYRFR